jgi:4'-phosphopantetheinyl transferase
MTVSAVKHSGYGPEPGFADIWVLRFKNTSINTENTLSALLSHDELQRSASMPPLEERRYRICRGTLRILLSRYLGIPPEIIEIHAGHYGKPELGNSHPPLMFNVSHTGDSALFGFTTGCEIGVDIEYRDRLADYTCIARRMFTVNEREQLTSLSDNDRRQFFFALWTRKEAVLKGIGRGLLLSMVALDVLSDQGGAVRFAPLIAADLGNWFVSDITIDPAFAAAWAVSDMPRSAVIRQLSTTDLVNGNNEIKYP